MAKQTALPTDWMRELQLLVALLRADPGIEHLNADSINQFNEAIILLHDAGAL
jgi:hypothetical protein